MHPEVIDQLRKVQKQILEHPKSFDMSDWIYEDECGTVCCIAGWVVKNDPRSKPENMDDLSIANRAQKLLRLDREQANRLFLLSEWPKDLRQRYVESDWNREFGHLLYAPPNPQALAECGVERIDRFINSNAAD